IREGSTQLNAFDEVGDKLNRTSAACGFRWNAEIRNKYINAIDLAKRQRKEMKRSEAKQNNIKRTPNPEYVSERVPQLKENTSGKMTIDAVITFLKNVKQDYYASNKSKETLELTEQENASLKEENEELRKKLAQTEKQFETMQ